LLRVVPEIDLKDKKLIISQITEISIEGFGAKSERIFWPFSKFTDSIVDNKERIIRVIIS
jgi:hypothetical protein